MNQGTDTKIAVQAAARSLFARHGYEGTSIRAITDLAGANLGAITYHFGSKETLYEAVLESIVTPLMARLHAAVVPGRAPLDNIEAIVRALFAFQAETPDGSSLMAHELALDHPVPGPLRRTMHGLMDLVSTQVRDGQADGSVVAGEPLLLTFSVVSQPMHLYLVRHRFGQVFRIDPSDAAVRQRFEAHIVRVVRRSLAAPGRGT
jgi:AcrR family transcriptional regulator